MKIIVVFFALLILAGSTTGCMRSLQADNTITQSSILNSNYLVDPLNNHSDSLLPALLAKYPGYFDSIISRKDELNIQVIYTQIDRGKKEKNRIRFTDHSFNLQPDQYFYPASTVKLPVAILALQKLRELNIPGLDRNTTMITGSAGAWQTAVNNDSSTASGKPSIAHYIKKILLVSDNDAFNRLYEFLGQEYINNNLHRMGYRDVQIIHRLSISLTDEENRFANPVSFLDNNGKIIYAKPAEKSQLIYANRDTKLGTGYLKGNELVNEPFDFSKKNRLPLQDLHHIIRSILFPADTPKEERFNLAKEDYDFLRLYMSMRPGESSSPLYSAPDYWDNYTKMIYYGAEKTNPEPGIRIFNKTGTAYGFLIDACYFADSRNNIEFMLSAVIYCNSDGIFNDDKYEYNSVGYPFLMHLGRIVYEYELKRERKYPTRLSSFQFQYGQ
ncbi:MAG: serine hydrolase [Chitinophagaceae bacterium]